MPMTLPGPYYTTIILQLDEIEAIQQDPGKGNWSIILKSMSTAERLAECRFTLLEQQVFPTPYNVRLIASLSPHPRQLLTIFWRRLSIVQRLNRFSLFSCKISRLNLENTVSCWNHTVKGRLKRFYLLTSPCTGVELHSYTRAGFPGARIATQPLTKGKKVFSLWWVRSRSCWMS